VSYTVTVRYLASSIIKDGNLVISGGTKVFHLPPGIAPPGATVAPGASGGGVQAAADHGVGRLLFPPTGNNQDGSSGAGVGGRRVVEVLKGILSGVTYVPYLCLKVPCAFLKPMSIITRNFVVPQTKF
jgi:hypothetical protein